MIKIKRFNTFKELILNNNSIIFLDNSKDLKYLNSLGFNCININNIHNELSITDKTFMDELEKLIFISKKLNKEFDETIIEIGNFITEFSIYNLEEKLSKKTNITHKNLDLIKKLFQEYQEYKKENNLYDIVDGIKYSIEKYQQKYENVYLYNINYVDEERFKLFQQIIKTNKNVFILKEENTKLSFFERKLKPKTKTKLSIKAKQKQFETKMSIFNFLNKYKENESKDELGIILLNQKTFSPFVNSIKNKDLNFILSLFKIKENNFDLYDVDNLFIYLELHDLRLKLHNISKTSNILKTKKDLFENFKEENKFIEILKLLDGNKNKILNKLISEYSFMFLTKIENYLKKLEDEDFSFNLQKILFLYLAKKEEIGDINGIEVIPFSKIKEKKTVFVLYGGIKKQKDSFLANNHRLELDLVHSDLYIDLQKEYIEKLAEFENVVFLDFKYGINEINEDTLYLELEEEKFNIKNNINSMVNINYQLNYQQILNEEDITINVNDLHLLINDKNKIIEKYLLLEHDYLLNVDEQEINNFLRKILINIFEDKNNFNLLKNKDVGNILVNFYKELNNVIKSNYPIKFKSKILFFKNKLNTYIQEEIKRINLITNYENNVHLELIYKIDELDKKEVAIDIEIDRIDYYENGEVDIIFYSKEPFTWYNKYHKTKFLKKILPLKGFKIKNIKYFNLY